MSEEARPPSYKIYFKIDTASVAIAASAGYIERRERNKRKTPELTQAHIEAQFMAGWMSGMLNQAVGNTLMTVAGKLMEIAQLEEKKNEPRTAACLRQVAESAHQMGYLALTDASTDVET